MRTRSLNPLVRFFTRGFARNGTPNWRWICGTTAFGLAQICAIVAATYADGSWYLHERDRGLFEHYGAWTLLATDPLLLISAALAYRQFRTAMSTLPLCLPGATPSRVRQIQRPHIDFIHLRGRAQWVYLLFLFVGLLAWANNLRQTSNPEQFFGHDVFDSTSFRYGFIVYKLILFNSWVLIYPIVGFLLITMCFSVRIILTRLQAQHMICPNVLHPDGCYGLANLGTLNLCLLFPYLLAFSVVFAVALTHEAIYASLVIPLLVLSIVFIVVSVVTIKPILIQAKRIERATYKRLVEASAWSSRTAADRILFALERICFGNASASPYSRGAKVILLVMRTIPVLATGAKSAWSYWT